LLRVSGVPLRTQLGVIGPAVRSAVVAGVTTIDLGILFPDVVSWRSIENNGFGKNLVYYETRVTQRKFGNFLRERARLGTATALT